MSLRGFKPLTETVALPDGETFSVRGLSLEDISILLRHHYEPIRVLFDRYVGAASAEAVTQTLGAEDVGPGLEDVFRDALSMAPGLLADAIALGADEPDLADAARKLPVGVQIDAVEKVITLTLKAEGGVEKLTETVTRLANGLTSLNVDRSG